jgi:hypothetical protein
VYGSKPDVCEDEFRLKADNISAKVESLRDMITQQLGIDVVEEGLATAKVKLEVGWLENYYVCSFF